MHALCWTAAVPPSFSSRVSAECIAAGAVPILLHAAVAGTGDSKSTPEQRAAVSVLAKLAGSSEEHQAALLTQLIPLLVGWIHSNDEETLNSAAPSLVHWWPAAAPPSRRL